MESLVSIMTLFDFIGDIRIGEFLFFRKAIYIKKYHFWSRFLKWYYKENLEFQLILIKYKLILLEYYLKTNTNERIIHLIEKSILNLKRGLEKLDKTYNGNYYIQKLINKLTITIKNIR